MAFPPPPPSTAIASGGEEGDEWANQVRDLEALLVHLKQKFGQPGYQPSGSLWQDQLESILGYIRCV